MNRKANLKQHSQSDQYIKDLHFTKCRACGSKDLVKFEVDTFCMDCDWNSVLMDVACGNFEKRIAIVNRKRHQSQAPTEQHQISEEEVIQEIGA
jgi:hypothetical protein